MANATTIRPDEAAHFGKLATDWWDPKGSSAMLHRLNPVRLGFVRQAIDAHWQGDASAIRPLAGKRALDTDMPAVSKFEALPGRRRPGPAAFLTVQEGCDKFCTYCVVPYTRGAEISRPWAAIIDEAKVLVDAGAREITQLGQNVNAWTGEDEKGRTQGLDGLIRALDALPGLARIRYTTSHPNDMSDSLIAAHGEVAKLMVDAGLRVEGHHHEVASGGQGEIDLKYGPLVQMADNVLKYKYIVRNTAIRNGKTATFMPKPLFQDNGAGMHVHASLWCEGNNLFAGSGYAGLSDLGLYAIGGLLRHGRALAAITNPTTNSYKRLVPGFDAPTTYSYSSRNRSAAVRIPVYSARPQARRLEFRCPDGSCNPYLAFSAILMAMLDGIKNRIHPGEPLDRNIYDLEPEELTGLPSTPRSLDEALDALERDHDFLLQGDVFTKDVLETWIRYKREFEVEAMRIRPHPFEFALYYDS